MERALESPSGADKGSAETVRSVMRAGRAITVVCLLALGLVACKQGYWDSSTGQFRIPLGGQGTHR